MRVYDDIDQGSKQWLSLRCGLPTGSAFGRVITGKGKPSDSLADYGFDLAIEKFKGKVLDETFSGNRHTHRGHELEPETWNAYEMDYGLEIRHVAFVTDETNGIVTRGVSPDGLIEGDGVFEGKCLSDKEHIKLLRYYKKYGVCPPKYVPQTQGEMLVCERKYCDLFFYHPDFRSVVIRQTPDPVFVAALNRQLMLVIAERNIRLNELMEIAA